MSDLPNQVGDAQDGPRRSKLLILGVLLVCIGATLIPSLIGRTLLTKEGAGASQRVADVVIPTGYLVMVVLAVLLIRWTIGTKALDIRWFRRNHQEIRWGLLLAFAVLVAAIGVFALMARLGIPWKANPGLRLRDPHAILLFVMWSFFAVFLAPIAEEYFWRGCVQGALERVMGAIPALVTQAMAFAAGHLRPLGGFVEVLVFGLIVGAWRWRRRTLLPIIVAHIVINAMSCGVRWLDVWDVQRIHPTTNYVAQMNERVRPSTYDPNHDARYEYDNAFESVVKMPVGFDSVRNEYPTRWSDAVHEEVRNWVAANEEAFRHVALGTEKPYYCPMYEGNHAIAAALPEMARLRTLVFAMGARIKLDASEGKEQQAIDDVVTLYRFGRHFSGPKVLVHQLAGLGACELAVGSIRQIVSNKPFSPQALLALQQNLEQFRNNGGSSMDFSLERLVWLDNVQLLFTDDGNSQGHMPRSSIKYLTHGTDSLMPGHKETWDRLNRLDVTRHVDRFFDLAWIASLQVPWEYRRGPSYVKGQMEQLIQEDPFVEMFGSGYVQAMEIQWRHRTSLDATITILALLRYAADHGGYPESLGGLVDAGYLRSIPRDTYSDGPLVYRSTEDSFLLYSLGADFDDDGGVPSTWGKGDKGGDQVFWPDEGTSDRQDHRDLPEPGNDGQVEDLKAVQEVLARYTTQRGPLPRTHPRPPFCLYTLQPRRCCPPVPFCQEPLRLDGIKTPSEYLLFL